MDSYRCVCRALPKVGYPLRNLGCPSIVGHPDGCYAGRFGFTQRTVGRPESGYHDTRSGTIRDFAQVLGVKPRELLKTKLQGDRD